MSRDERRRGEWIALVVAVTALGAELLVRSAAPLEPWRAGVLPGYALLAWRVVPLSSVLSFVLLAVGLSAGALALVRGRRATLGVAIACVLLLPAFALAMVQLDEGRGPARLALHVLLCAVAVGLAVPLRASGRSRSALALLALAAANVVAWPTGYRLLGTSLFDLEREAGSVTVLVGVEDWSGDGLAARFECRDGLGQPCERTAFETGRHVSESVSPRRAAGGRRRTGPRR